MSAAYLQALHAQEEGEEVPELPQEASTSMPAPPSSQRMDLESEAAFPSLGGSVTGKGKKAMNGSSTHAAASPLWGNASSKSPLLDSRPETPTSAAAARYFRDTLTLDSAAISLALPSAAKPARRGEEAQPTSLGDAAALIMKLNPTVRVDASTAKASSTFLFVGPNEESVRKARNDLLARIVKKVSFRDSFSTSLTLLLIGQYHVRSAIIGQRPYNRHKR